METGDLEWVRKALKSGVRKDLQAAAKSAGIKANGTNVAMTTALKEYMQARAEKLTRVLPEEVRGALRAVDDREAAVGRVLGRDARVDASVRHT